MTTYISTVKSISGPTLALALIACMPGCSWEEGLVIDNVQGTVRIPKEAGTRALLVEGADGTVREETRTDVKLLGPVYLGLFPSVLEANIAASYPHPELGPQYREGIIGDTYPYGGTTIGDLRYACLESLACRVVSGRYLDFDDMIDWFADLGQPIVDAEGEEVINGETIRQTCFDLLEVTSDEEIRVTATDSNGDGKVNENDLDFQLKGDFFEADFTLWQQEWFWDVREEETKGCEPGRTCTGPTLWGYMDAPSELSFKFSTCDPELGLRETDYNLDFFGGKADSSVLNIPTNYITEGDWVAGTPYVWNDIFDRPVLTLDWEVTQ